jgi:hypothetical protein
MLAPGEKARLTADCETRARRATSDDVAGFRGIVGLNPKGGGGRKEVRALEYVVNPRDTCALKEGKPP